MELDEKIHWYQAKNVDMASIALHIGGGESRPRPPLEHQADRGTGPAVKAAEKTDGWASGVRIVTKAMSCTERSNSKRSPRKRQAGAWVGGLLFWLHEK